MSRAGQPIDLTRRRLAAALALAPLGVAGLATAARAQACYDPATLAFSLRSRRRTLGFVEVSPDPAKTCKGCEFFAASAGSCGACKLMTGGPVTAGGVCNSWAARK